jgi:hypothetical protein
MTDWMYRRETSIWEFLTYLFGEKDMALEKVVWDPFGILFGSEIPLFGD